MAKTLPASAFAVDGRVIVTKKDDTEVRGVVQKIIGGANDLLLILEEGADEPKKIRAERVRKARGPKPGSTRTPKAAGKAQTSSAVESDDEVESEELSLEILEQMVGALDQMKALIQGHIAFLNSEPEEEEEVKQTSKLAIGKAKAKGSKRPMAEDEDED